MTGFLRRIGHQITQCAPVSAFAWIAGQGTSAAGAAHPPGRSATDVRPVAAHTAPVLAAEDHCPGPAQVLASRAVAPAPAPVAHAVAPAASSAEPSGGSGGGGGGGGGGGSTSYVVGPRHEYHTDVRYLQIDDRDTTVSQHLLQRIVANGDVHTELNAAVTSGDGSTTVHVEQVEPGATDLEDGAEDGPGGDADADPGYGEGSAGDAGGHGPEDPALGELPPTGTHDGADGGGAGGADDTLDHADPSASSSPPADDATDTGHLEPASGDPLEGAAHADPAGDLDPADSHDPVADAGVDHVGDDGPAPLHDADVDHHDLVV